MMPLSLTRQLGGHDSILDQPALPPPEGVIPNFSNPKNHNHEARIGIFFCLVLIVVMIPARVYSTVFCMRKVNFEDDANPTANLFCVATQGPYIGYTYCLFHYITSHGFYVHQWDIKAQDLPDLLFTLHVLSVLYHVTMMTMKVSILKEWTRIFVPHRSKNTFYWTCYGLASINVLFYFACILVINLICIPHAAIWDKTISPSTCISDRPIWIGVGIVNLASDIVIVALPQKIIWHLQLSTKKKVGITFVFTFGILVCGCAAGRLVESINYLNSSVDVYNRSGITLWCYAEMTFTICAFCMPAAPRAFHELSRVRELKGFIRAGSRGRDKISSGWPVARAQSSTSRRWYHKVNDETNWKSLPLVRLAKSKSNPELDSTGNEDPGILRTTHVQITEEFAGNLPARRGHIDVNLCPWEAQHRV
ncbi:hypothetical protein F4778DRAFT_802188 [Xylariomycetidae sp. FL2044]|nr:hypothetical protein F4778DRAFT_802188 [Xylariomycetidae sp. FL2044]